MKGVITERNIVIILFVMVLITFSLAQNETNKIEQRYNGGQTLIRKYPDSKAQAKTSAPFGLKSSTLSD
jgi:hypothetical protein